jgi:hypothetical protein
MGANIAGIYGAQIFREDDKPRYRRAFSVACAILAFGLALAILRYVSDVYSRRRNARKASDTSSSGTENFSHEDGLADKEKVISAPPSDDQAGPILLGESSSPVVSQGLRATT